MPILESNFRPAWWLRGPHMQTLWPSISRRTVKIDVTRERVELPDGDFIDLAWHGPEDLPIVLLLHGLEGGVDSHYVRGLMKKLAARGFRSCLMHFRGCSGEPNRLITSYHSGLTKDPKQIARHIRQQHGGLYGAIGISLGGNVLLKWLGERGSQCRLQRAAVMSVPFVLRDAALRLHQGVSKVYERHLLNSLVESYSAKRQEHRIPAEVNLQDLSSLYAFDDRVTAPLHGFRDAEDYYAQSSSRQYIPKIRVPTLILHARDDPFMFPQSIPTERELPPNVFLEIASHGGHVGFIGGLMPGESVYWGEQRLAEWFGCQ